MANKLNAAHALHELAGFIGSRQRHALGDCCRGEERQWFYDRLVELAELTRTMPKVYEQDGKGAQAVAYLHYFGGAADAWITERDTTPAQHQAFGLVDLGYGAELGYISIAELTAAGLELDFHFAPRTLATLATERRARDTDDTDYTASADSADFSPGRRLDGGPADVRCHD